MAQETLKITITADNQQAVKNIEQTVVAANELGTSFDKIIPSSSQAGKNIEKVAVSTNDLGKALDKVNPANSKAVENMQQTVVATTKLGAAFKTLPNTSGQATNALTNLSRVAQDAPYGFIGIANNLNPLLESFQRLSKEAGGTGGALKAMASGLMGPAGIGLALGAVSSIIVAFGPKIADFISGTNEAAKAEEKFAQGLKDATAEASETGIRLQAYLNITQDASVSDQRRAEALRAVKNELSKVNSAYAATITNVDQARAAVDLYTKALVAQAITSRYIDEIANKTIALADANKKILQTGREYYATLESTKLAINGYADASVYQASAISKAKNANIDARNEALALRGGIMSLNTELAKTITLALDNPFFQLDKGAKQLAKSTKDIANNLDKINGKTPKPLGEGDNAPILMQRTGVISPATPSGLPPLNGRTSGFDAIKLTRDTLEQAKAQELFNFQLQQTQAITSLLAPAFDSVVQAMIMGEDIGKSLEVAFKQIVIQLVQMVAQALLFKAIMAAITGGTSEVGGALGGGMGMGGGNFLGEFLLKGSDLILATQRANNNLNIRRGN